MIAGVCAGLAAHLGLPVKVVRAAMVLLSLAGGAGLAVYSFWWFTVPAGDPQAAARASEPVSLQRLAARLNLNTVTERVRTRDVLIGVVLLVGAAFLIAVRSGWDWQQTWVIPLVLAAGGLTLAWSQLAAPPDGSTSLPRRTLLRPVAGLLLLVGGVLLLIGQDTPGWVMLQAGLAALAVLIGVALVVAPWWLRMVRELGDARAARAREAERADIAAHLHDSVLQTLALIRAQASNADAVARMARAQERELREWMYEDRPAPGTSFAAELRTLVAQVEDGAIGKPVYSTSPAAEALSIPAVAIDVVVVGDCPPTEYTSALLQATREALVNAVAHGRPPLSVYAEMTAQAAEVFVRDRGDGFDLEAIAADRFGVRESIRGRMQRRGGTAEIVSRPDWGTEVRLKMPLTATPWPAANPPAVAQPPTFSERLQP